jgi:hypothetical protein
VQALTEEHVRASFVNATADDRRIAAMPIDFVLLDWDHLDFLAWRDPNSRERGYIITQREGEPVGVVREVHGRGRRCATSATRCSRAIK